MDIPLVLPAGLQNILKKKTGLISLAIIGAGIFLAFQLYIRQDKKLKDIKKAISQEEEKIAVGKELGGLNDRISRLTSPYLKTANSLTIDKFNTISSETQTKIISITPDPEKNLGFYSSTVFNLKLQADYRAIGSFLKKLESQSGIIKIEELSITAAQNSKKVSQPSQARANPNNLLDINLKVNLIFIKNEQ